MALENNLVSDHSSSVLLTQCRIILFSPSRRTSTLRLWSLRWDSIPFFADITINISIAHFNYTTRGGAAILGMALSLRPSITLVKIWRPSDIGGRGGGPRSRGGGEDMMDGVSSLVSRDLPSSKVPRATVRPPDASLVMHQQSYATRS